VGRASCGRAKVSGFKVISDSVISILCGRGPLITDTLIIDYLALSAREYARSPRVYSPRLHENGPHLEAGQLFLHHGFGRFRGESVGRFEHFGKETHVAGGCEMDAGTC
jgi:hypothetical protein